MNNNQIKAVVKHSEMSKEMEQEVIEVAYMGIYN
jgi:hypothetical protein